MINWKMVAHINRGDKPHGILYNGTYRVHDVILKSFGENERKYSVHGFPTTWDNEKDMIEFLKDKKPYQKPEPSEQEKEYIEKQKILFDKLEVARIKAGMTIRDIAKAFNMSPLSYCDYRNARRLMSNKDVEWFQIGFEFMRIINKGE